MDHQRPYYENGCRVAVDHTTPVDTLEPETEPTHEVGCMVLTLTERIASTYTRGDPEVTRIAWRFPAQEGAHVHPRICQKEGMFRCRNQQARADFVGRIQSPAQQRKAAAASKSCG